MSWALGRAGTHELVSETDRSGKPLRTVICMETGLVRNDPVPSDAELAQFYSADYRIVYKGAAKPRRRQVLRNFRRVADHLRTYGDVFDAPVQMLDVGAGSGEFLFMMEQLGKTVKGIEPNAPYAAYCREELGLDVQTSHLKSDLFAPGQFDFIRMNHVLEHLNDPVRYLHQIARWLAPHGLLYVEVPNIEVDCRERSRGRLFHYAHIYNFNPWTLRTCAGLAGLTEAPETRQRSLDTTSVFFRRDEAGARCIKTDSLENAHRVRDLIRAHYASAIGRRRVSKPFVTFARLVEESMTGLALGSPAATGAHVTRRLPLEMAGIPSDPRRCE